MKLWHALVLVLMSLALPVTAAEEPPKPYSEQSIYDKPLMERYVLDELKSIRQDMQSLEKRVTVDITDRELAVADKSMNYANVTVTYFFYLIAAAVSLIALVGWQSLKDIRDKTQEMANEKLEAIAAQYEKKFQEMERELKRKSRIITENNKEIERINEIHNLWIRAQHSQTPEQRIEIYNDILKIRPGDLEALTYKADAAMEMGEYHWALSICNRVLEVDPRTPMHFISGPAPLPAWARKSRRFPIWNWLWVSVPHSVRRPRRRKTLIPCMATNVLTI